MSLADLDRWNPDSIRSVAAAATNRANDFRDVAHDQGAIVAKLEWEGVAHDAATVRARTVSDSLLEHAAHCDRASRDVSAAAGEVESIKAEWIRIQRMADRWGVMIDIANGSVDAHDQRRLELVHDAILDLLRRAESTDLRLTVAIRRAMSEMATDVGSDDPVTSDPTQLRNQVDAFRRMFGRDPTTSSDWSTAAVLDPHSYAPKNAGVPPSIVVGRIKPVPGQGVVRANLFIPGAKAWTPLGDNLGDDRGFDPNAGPEESRVMLYTDYDNGAVIARQNPSVLLGSAGREVQAGDPDIRVSQNPNGSVLIQYRAADPFSPGGENIAKATPFNVNGSLVIKPTPTGPIVGGTISDFPAVEVYNDNAGQTKDLGKIMPQNTSVFGPLAGLPFSQTVGPGLMGEFPDTILPAAPPLPSSIPGTGSMPHTPAVAQIPAPVVIPYPSVELSPVESAPPVPVGR